MKHIKEFTLNEIFSTNPVDLKNVSSLNKDKEILRMGILAELDAINLYEQLSEKATNKKIKETLLDIAKEEKTHVGEFEALLNEIDPEHEEELKKGKKEVNK
jgi:rubrerythrin